MTKQADFISSFELNPIHARRARLTFEEAIAVWLMHWSGDYSHIIAAKLGTNPGRVADVLTEKTHVGSRIKAFELRAG